MSKSLRAHRRLDQLLSRPFICPSCSQSQSRRTLPHKRAPHQRRTATTLSSNTAVNATRSVPDRYKALYTALSDVRRDAAAYVPFSRLHLALQGLESTNPRIRIAVLGLSVEDTARKLVRLLLADPLEPEARWEQDLDKTGTSYEQGLLIRYGEQTNPNIPRSKASIPTLEIHSPLLERANLEIHISSVTSPSPGRNQKLPVDTFLAPVIGTPSAFSGRHTIISQPVHRAIVVARGLEEMIQVAELLAMTDFASKEDRQSVRVVMQHKDVTAGGQVFTIDADRAREGLEAIRQSLAQARIYEHQWVDSGLPSVSAWFTEQTKSVGTIPPPVTALISAILQSATVSLEVQAEASSKERNVDLATTTNLGMTIDDFSRNAHQELQSGLASAWSSQNWRKLAWYKLFWRVDDVGLIVTDLITNAWLPRTERAVYELSGRLAQAGISPMEMVAPPVQVQQTLPEEVSPASAPVPVLQAQGVTASESMEPVIVNSGGNSTIALQPTAQPIPLSASISSTRATQMSRAIDSLTTTAQQLVFRTLSITGLSAGLSGLTYVSLTPGSPYEAGTIVALGTALALWRMQGGWQRATKAMEDELYNEGRTTIRRITGSMRGLVDEHARPRIDQVEESRWQAAWGSVERAKTELQKLIKNDTTGAEKR